MFRRNRAQLLQPALLPALVLFLTAGLLALPSSSGAQSSASHIRTTDLLSIVQLTSVDVSPDGAWVVYGTRTMVEEDSKDDPEAQGDDTPKLPRYAFRNHLYLVPFDGSTPPRALTHGDQQAASPAWSPDGSRLAFVRSADGAPQLFILPLRDGGESWQLTRWKWGGFGPQWSTDGRHIAFTTFVDEAQAHRFPETGEKDTARSEPAAVMEPSWATERPRRRNGDEARWGDSEAEKPTASPDGGLAEVREWLARNAAADNPRVLDRLHFLGEQDLAPRLEYSHAAWIEVREGAEPAALTRGFQFLGAGPVRAGSAQPEAGWMVITGLQDLARHPDRVEDSALYRLGLDPSGTAPAGAKPEPLVDLAEYSVFDPVLSPDGRLLAFRAAPQEEVDVYGVTRLGVLPLDAAGRPAGEPRMLTEGFDRSVGTARFSPDGRHLYFVAPSDGDFPLYRIPVVGGEPLRLTPKAAGVRAFDIGGKGVAYALTEVANPYELYAAALPASQGGDEATPLAARRLSAHNADWLAGKKLSYPTAHRLTRPDGLEVDYWVMKPVGFQEGKTYPLLVEMHGGPAAMWGPGEVTMWHELQLFAARGFGIVYANPRGSGGYGRDFEAANHRDWGIAPAGDVLAAVDAVAKLDWVDPDRLVLTGGSYAGYLTAWIVGHDHRFQAAAAQRGVYDFATFLGEGNAWELVRTHQGGYPWEEGQRDFLTRESPLTYAHEIRTPLLIIHSDQDLRTGVIQSEMLYKTLKILEKPVEYVRYPNSGHGLSRTGDPLLRMDRLNRLLEFFWRYVGAE